MKSSSFFVALLGLAAVILPGRAFAQMSPESVSPPRTLAMMAAPPPAHVVYRAPEHLEVGDQLFDGSVSGFRTYLDTKRTTDPELFAQLDPRVRQLESQAITAREVLVVGLVAGVASTIYAVAGRRTCDEPPVTDPNFAAKSQAWGDCNSENGTHLATFALIGLGAVTLGGLGAWAIAPNRSDVMNLINEHNRLSHEPIRLQVGYDPTSRLALGGVSSTF